MTPNSPLSSEPNDSPRLSWQDADEATRARLFEFTIEHANDPILITTTELTTPGPHIVYVNRAFTRLSGFTAEEAIGQTPRILQGPLTNRAEMERMRTELQQGHSFLGETINYRKDGSPYHMEWSVHGLCDDEGVLHFYVAIQRDISARKEYESKLARQAYELECANARLERTNAQLADANAELERANSRLAALSLTDSLTGLSNHRAFHTRLDEELARAKRDQTLLSLLLIDVDRFKSYNDSFGHPAGDDALQQIALLLQTHARPTDCVARPGGEEFAVLLPNTDRSTAFQIAERLRQTIETHDWPLRPVTISIGIGTINPQESTLCALIPQADQALYNSKSQGRNCVS